MKRYITFPENEVDEAVRTIEQQIEHIEKTVKMMREQAEGKRTNLNMNIHSFITEDIYIIRQRLDKFKKESAHIGL